MDVKKEILDTSTISSASFANILSSTSKNLVIKEENSTREKLNFLVEGFNETIEQNTAINNETLILFSELDITKNRLSNLSKEITQKLKIIEGEDLIDIDETNFKLNLMYKKFIEKKQQREERKMKHMYDKSFKNFDLLDDKLQSLTQLIFEMEIDLQNKCKSIEFDSTNQHLLEKKITEYEEKIGQLDIELQNMDITEIYPLDILNKSDLCSEKRGQLITLNEELSYYADLPPNLLRAKVALEQKISEYEEINHTLVNKMR